MRRIWAMGATAAGVVFAAVLFARESIAEYVFSRALRQAGLADVSVNVSRVGVTGLTIDEVTAEGGALLVGQIEADYTPLGLVLTRIDAVRIGKLGARLTWTEDGLGLGAFRLRRSEEPLVLPNLKRFDVANGSLTVVTPSAELQAPFTISAQSRDSIWSVAVKADVSGPGVAVTAAWNGRISALDLAGSEGQGSFTLDIRGFAVPGLTDRFDAAGVLTVDAGDGSVALRIPKPLTFSFDAPPLGVKSLDTLPWSITLAPSRSEAGLILTEKNGEQALDFDLSATAMVGQGRVAFAAAGRSQTGQAAPRFELGKGRIEVEGFPVAGGAVTGALELADVAGTLRDAKGRLDANLKLRNVVFEGATIEDAQASIASTLGVADGTFTAAVNTLAAQVAHATWASWTLDAPAQLTLAKGDAATFTWSPASGAVGNFGLSIPEVRLRGDDEAWIVARAPDVKIRAQGSSVTLTLRDTALSHPAGEFQNGRLDATYGAANLSGKLAASLVRVGPLGEDETSRPESALAVAAALSSSANSYDIKGTLTAASGSKFGDFNGQFDKSFARGSASLSIQKKRFVRGGKPDAADLGFLTAVSDLSGTLGLTAKAAWRPGAHEGRASLVLDDVSFARGDMSVAGVTATLDLADLLPPRAEKTQSVSVKSIVAGLPLQDLRADLVLPGDGHVNVLRGGLNVAGGRMTLSDARIPIDGQDGAFSLAVEKIDMEQLSALAKVDGLSITGTLSGAVPLRTEKGTIHFAGGALRADAPGRLVYKPATPPEALAQNQGGSLLLQALSNFAYDRLSITLDGPVTEDVSVGVSLAGRNPDLYGGYPIEFNLNLSGRLTQILTQGLVGVGIPTNIERQIREGQKSRGG